MSRDWSKLSVSGEVTQRLAPERSTSTVTVPNMPSSRPSCTSISTPAKATDSNPGRKRRHSYNKVARARDIKGREGKSNYELLWIGQARAALLPRHRSRPVCAAGKNYKICSNQLFAV